MKLERDSRYDELRRRFDRDPKYWVEYLKLVFSEDVGRLMDEHGRAELAKDSRRLRGPLRPVVETPA